MLFGTLVNRAGKVLRLDAGRVRVLDAQGRSLPAAATFSAGFDARIALRGYRSQLFAEPAAGTPTRTVLAPRATVPLSVSWSGHATAVEVEGTRLALH
jgi:hypothetical protein